MESLNLSDISIAEEYYSGESDLIQDFYKPCLEAAQSYDRSVGFFRSSVFLLIGPEIIKFAQRGGKLRLICSPSFISSDIEAINQGYANKQDIIPNQLQSDIQDMMEISEILPNTKALATLVKFEVLDIKIAFMLNANGLYHAKLGIISDKNHNKVVFKGSANETWNGWHERGNHETLDVFASWKGGRDERQVYRDSEYFERLWNNQIKSLEVVKFPDVCKKKLMKIADKSLEDMDPNEIIDFYSPASKGQSLSSAKNSYRTPLKHQLQALEAWKDQNYKGILEHATGSGKTFTALTALKEHLLDDGIALILVPDRLLHKQWTQEIKEEIPNAVLLKAGDGFNSWKKNARLNKFSRPLKGAGQRIILATMATSRTNQFCENIFGGEHLMLIADEVHEIGSEENSKALRIDSGKRLGLSATPKRYGDPVGTKRINDYFGPIIQPPFTLIDAIKQSRLVEYEYHPEPIHLSPEESEQWEKSTKEISKEYARSQKNDSGSIIPSPRLKNLLIQRSRIAKKALEKIPYALGVIKNNYTPGESWLVYCEDQYQLKELLTRLRDEGYSPLEYHTNMFGDPSASLTWFRKFGGIMVSIRCLDQGVDIPKISHAIILASSQNPRQFIQRRGRVLRVSKDKYMAKIYDAIVVPFSLEHEPTQLSLLKSELQRSLQFSKTALNKSGANKLLSIAIELGIDPEEMEILDTDGIEENGEMDE